MSVADVAAVDAALVAVLAGDATLAALLPDGVWIDVATKGATRFAIVQQQTHEDTEGFRAPLYETCQYRITARVLEKTGVDVNAAAFRIHQLLQDAPLAAAGYAHMTTLRGERIKLTEVDAGDKDIRWQIAGADYEVFVSPM